MTDKAPPSIADPSASTTKARQLPRVPQQPPIARPLPYKAKVVSTPKTSRDPSKQASQQAPTQTDLPQQKQQHRKPAASASTPKPRTSTLGTALRTPSKLRPIFLTVAVAAITATGAWYGAGLKIQQEAKETRAKTLSAGPDERIRGLEEARRRLDGARKELVGKIGEVKARRAASEEAAIAAASEQKLAGT